MDGDLRSIAHGMWHWVFYSDRTRIVLSLFVNRYRAILIFDVNTIERTLVIGEDGSVCLNKLIPYVPSQKNRAFVCPDYCGIGKAL